MVEFTLSTDKSKIDIEVIHDFLTNRSYWAKNRSIETVKRSVENSLCFGMYDSEEKMIGFARIVTDYSVFAYIMDVFILEDYRKMGLGKKLMDYIMQHPDLQGLQRIMLTTNDAHGLYAQYGFKKTLIADKLMEIINRPR
ncbi:MAG: GNAT family N-acetyltransferase [Bacteroidales bacterium]|jgi:N-acetylglutamate synthase-like GNAT family acetyltransferase|nr:GNAT family N-acetyltransferase [Bacteroidales bacterium]